MFYYDFTLLVYNDQPRETQKCGRSSQVTELENYNSRETQKVVIILRWSLFRVVVNTDLTAFKVVESKN